jgi:hypothetical protein
MTEPTTSVRKNWFLRHKVPTGLLVLVALIVIASVTSGGAKSTTASSTTASETSSAAPAKPKAAGIGTAVRDGKFEFTVTKVQAGVATVGPEALNQKAQGQYVLVTMTVKNIGDKAQMFDASSQKLTDTAGKATYSADSAASLYANSGGETFLKDINPGNQITGTVVFDIPAGAVPARIELHDSAFSGGVKVALK